MVAGNPATPSITRTQAVLAASSAAVGLLSYACTLLMAHLLSPRDYTHFPAAQALLTMVGVAATSLVPLPLARIVRTYPARSDHRRDGAAFAIAVSTSSGIGAGITVS